MRQHKELARNGDFKEWTAGEQKAPDQWHLGGGPPGTGEVKKDTSVVKEGSAAARIENFSNSTALYQDISDPQEIRGKDYVFSCWVKASKPKCVALSLDDGVKAVSSSVNSGSSEWERLIERGKIDDKATKVRLHIWVSNNATAYVDSVSFKVGEFQ